MSAEMFELGLVVVKQEDTMATVQQETRQASAYASGSACDEEVLAHSVVLLACTEYRRMIIQAVISSGREHRLRAYRTSCKEKVHRDVIGISSASCLLQVLQFDHHDDMTRSPATVIYKIVCVLT